MAITDIIKRETFDLLAELLTDKNEYSKAKEILDGIQYNSQNSFLLPLN